MKYIVLFVFAVSLMGCNLQSEAQALNSMRDSEKVWVFAQFNIDQEDDDLETYYYYGLVAKKLYKAIAYNEIESGFMLMEEVKYWSDDLIHDYEDGESAGELVFRIEDVVKMELIKVEPIAGQGSDQFDESVDEPTEEEDKFIGQLPSANEDN